MYRLFAASVFYPTHWWNILMSRVFSFRNWWDEVDEKLILGARPNPADGHALAELGVTGVVNTCEEYCGPTEVYLERDIEQLHIPTTDFTHPKIEDVEAAVDFINRHVERGGKVYVHCKAGRARSATIAICWLMDYKKMTGIQAQSHLTKIRHQVNRRLLQRPVVKEFMQRRGLSLN